MTNLRQPPARPVRMRGRDHALDEWTAHGSTLYYYDVGVSIFAGARLTPSPLPAPPALVAELMHDESVERGGQLAN